MSNEQHESLSQSYFSFMIDMCIFLIQYRSLCCNSESMFNLVVHSSSTRSLVGGTGDAILQARATPKAHSFFIVLLLQPFVSKTKTSSALCFSLQSNPTLRSSCSRKGADSLNVAVLKSFHCQLAASASQGPTSHYPRPAQQQLRQEPVSHCMSRKIWPKRVHEWDASASNSSWALLIFRAFNLLLVRIPQASL